MKRLLPTSEDLLRIGLKPDSGVSKRALAGFLAHTSNLIERHEAAIIIVDWIDIGSDNRERTTKFQYAIDGSKGREVILFSEVPIELTGPIFMKSGCILNLNGCTVCCDEVYDLSSGDEPLIQIVGNRVSLMRGTISGKKLSGPTVSRVAIQVKDSANRFHLADLYLSNFKRSGIVLLGCNWLSNMERIRIDTVGGCGYEIAGGENTTLRFSNCYVVDCEKGFDFFGCYGSSMEACAVDHCRGTAFSFHNSIVNLAGCYTEYSELLFFVSGWQSRIKVSASRFVHYGSAERDQKFISVKNGVLFIECCVLFSKFDGRVYVEIEEDKGKLISSFNNLLLSSFVRGEDSMGGITEFG